MRLKIWRAREGKDLGKGTPRHVSDIFCLMGEGKNLPILLGSTDSLSMLDWTQDISCSMYAGAAILVGRL